MTLEEVWKSQLTLLAIPLNHMHLLGHVDRKSNKFLSLSESGTQETEMGLYQ